ncbi:hypothetical protein J6590_043995 [Homalodisca vitripennis]|nr:hypothetical protein J6590_043995 [Homalodisca vitripennis]
MVVETQGRRAGTTSKYYSGLWVIELDWVVMALYSRACTAAADLCQGRLRPRRHIYLEGKPNAMSSRSLHIQISRRDVCPNRFVPFTGTVRGGASACFTSRSLRLSPGFLLGLSSFLSVKSSASCASRLI